MAIKTVTHRSRFLGRKTGRMVGADIGVGIQLEQRRDEARKIEVAVIRPSLYEVIPRAADVAEMHERNAVPITPRKSRGIDAHLSERAGAQG